MDVHKRYTFATILGPEGETLAQKKMNNEEVPAFLRSYPVEHIAMEATTSIAPLHRMLTGEGYTIHVAHPKETRTIAKAKIKTDKTSSRALAELLRVNGRARATGRLNREKRDSMRITIPDLMRLAEEQTEGFITMDDWFPVPAAKPLTDLLSGLKGERFVDFATHPHCGMATYLLIEDDHVIPITRLMDVDEVLASFENAALSIQGGEGVRDRLHLLNNLSKVGRFKMLRQYLKDVVLRSDYLSLNRMHHNMILISTMHFMDPYNFDLDRVQRCVIHYASPDGRIIPFCTMNTLHRKRVEKKFAKASGEDTPLYDVEPLRKRILREAVRSQSPIYRPLQKNIGKRLSS